MKKLSRRSNHRKALRINLAKSLITYKSITSTITKVKVLRPFIEKLITKAKDNSLSTIRYLFDIFRSKTLVEEILKIGALHKDRNGGYTRIVRTETRNGITRGNISILNE